MPQNTAGRPINNIGAVAPAVVAATAAAVVTAAAPETAAAAAVVVRIDDQPQHQLSKTIAPPADAVPVDQKRYVVRFPCSRVLLLSTFVCVAPHSQYVIFPFLFLGLLLQSP